MEQPERERGAPLRVALFGALAGALFAALRAPSGLTWTELPAPRGLTSALFAAAPWFAVALLLDGRRRAFAARLSIPALLAATAAGYLVWAGWVTTRLRPESRLGFALLFVVGTLALALAAGRRTSARSEPGDPALARLGLAGAAAGVALALANLAQHVRLFGLGLPEEDGIAAVVLLLLLAIGAGSFGGLVARPGWERALLGVGAVGAAVATEVGLRFLAGMDGDALFAYLKRFGRDLSTIGMLPTTALLAAATLVVPGLVAGSALRGARGATRLGTIALGAGLGVLLHPFAVAQLAGPPAPPGLATWSGNVLVAATAVAGLGALVFLGAGERGRMRPIACVLVLALAAVPCLRPRLAFTRFSPWYPAPIDPDLVLPTAEGILTVEPYVDGTRIVTLDRKRLTPIHAEEHADDERFLRALALAQPPTGRALRMLVIGQLDPARSQLLRQLGSFEVDRTAPWFEVLPAIEAALFPVDEPPVGTAIPPGEAERRIDSGRYDLVLALPVRGPVIQPKSQALIPWGSSAAPALGGLDVPEGTTAVAWLDANSPLAHAALGERVIYSADHFQHSTIGVVRGRVRVDPTPDMPALLRGGSPEARLETWELLSVLPRERSTVLERALFERLARANAGGPCADLARGLALHYGAQEMSSPFETLAQQTEFVEDELRAFQAAGRTKELDRTTRDVLEDVAWLLTEKRESNMVFSYLEDVAEIHQPWVALDRALARANEEILEPKEALRYYDRIFDTPRSEVDLRELERASDVALEAGDPARAADYARRGLAIQPESETAPDRFTLRLCRALVAAGTQEGFDMLERLRPNLTPEELFFVEGTSGPPAPEDATPDASTPADDEGDDAGGERAGGG